MAYNKKHGITPETIQKAIRKGIEEEIAARKLERESAGISTEEQFVTEEFIRELEGEMLTAAEQLDFERAAQLRPPLEAGVSEQARGGGSLSLEWTRS